MYHQKISPGKVLDRGGGQSPLSPPPPLLATGLFTEQGKPYILSIA